MTYTHVICLECLHPLSYTNGVEYVCSECGRCYVLQTPLCHGITVSAPVLSPSSSGDLLGWAASKQHETIIIVGVLKRLVVYMCVVGAIPWMYVATAWHPLLQRHLYISDIVATTMQLSASILECVFLYASLRSKLPICNNSTTKSLIRTKLGMLIACASTVIIALSDVFPYLPRGMQIDAAQIHLAGILAQPVSVLLFWKNGTCMHCSLIMKLSVFVFVLGVIMLASDRLVYPATTACYVSTVILYCVVIKIMNNELRILIRETGRRI